MNTIKRFNLCIIIILIIILGGNEVMGFNFIDDKKKISYNISVKNYFGNFKIFDRQQYYKRLQTTTTSVPTPISRAETRSYTQEEIDLLTRLVNCEAGSDWLTDEHQQLVVMVVLNRVKSDKFPNTIKEVIYQKGQYSSVGCTRWYKQPTERVIKNVMIALNGGISCPENVVFQSESELGSGIYKKFYNSYKNNYTYFCYSN